MFFFHLRSCCWSLASGAGRRWAELGPYASAPASLLPKNFTDCFLEASTNSINSRINLFYFDLNLLGLRCQCWETVSDFGANLQ